MGSGGATGGGAGTGGTAGSATTSCPPAPSCNWCGGQSQQDGRGCITGWRCANGVNPCSVNPCTESSPCEAGKTCGSDHLCWPSGAGGAGGVTGTGGVAGAGGVTGTGGVDAGGFGGGTGTGVRVCGSIGGIPCQAGEFCEYSAEACQIMDSYGVCSKPPASCPDDSESTQPVCGCDGKTYANDCERRRALMSKLSNGACGATTGSDGGITSSLSIGPSSASFSEGIGLTSQPVTFVVMNHGPGASGGLNVTITGESPRQFVVSNNNCVAFLPAGQSCQVLIAFAAPSTPGTYSATLGIKESGEMVLTAPLSGYAFPPPGTADAGTTDAPNGTECPETLPTTGSECSAGPNTWCSYMVTDPMNQMVCNCGSLRWNCSIASP